MKTAERLAAIAEREKKATSGPWKESTDEPGDVVIWGPKEDWLANVGNWARQRPDIEPQSSAQQYVEMRDAADGSFIANAREDVPWLLAEVRRLREALANAKLDTDHNSTGLGSCLCRDCQHNAAIDVALGEHVQ